MGIPPVPQSVQICLVLFERLDQALQHRGEEIQRLLAESRALWTVYLDLKLDLLLAELEEVRRLFDAFGIVIRLEVVFVLRRQILFQDSVLTVPP